MVSAFHLSLTFVVFCALAGSFATPTAPTPAVKAVGTHSLSTANLEQSIAQIQTQVQDSLKNLTRVSEWMFYRLRQIVRNIVQDRFESLTTWAVELILRVETFTIADGSHYSFPLTSQPDLEAEYKTTGISVSKLLTSLKTMKRADALITKTVQKVVDESDLNDFVRIPTEKYLKTLLHLYFQTLDHMFTDNSELGVEYKKLYAEAAEVVKQNPAEMHEPLIPIGVEIPETLNVKGVELFLQDKLTLRQVIANKGFMKQSAKNLFMILSPTEHRRFLMANAIMQKAASADSSAANKINEIYQQALAKAGQVPVNKDSFAIADALFAALEKGLESEPELQKEIQVSMNEMETKTVYNIDVLHLDFSLL